MKEDGKRKRENRCENFVLTRRAVENKVGPTHPTRVGVHVKLCTYLALEGLLGGERGVDGNIGVSKVKADRCNAPQLEKREKNSHNSTDDNE